MVREAGAKAPQPGRLIAAATKEHVGLLAVLLAVLVAGCGGHEPSEDQSAAGVVPGFHVKAETPGDLRVLSFTPQGSSLTCTAFFGSDLTRLGWTSDLPPPADLAPIAIAANQDDEDVNIHLVAPDGSWVRRLTGGSFSEVHHPSWSPDGTRMSVSQCIKPADIWTMNAAGKSRRRVTDETEHTTAGAWRPTGGQLAFRHGEGKVFNIFTVSVRGGAWHQLTDTAYVDRAPEWSPDGSQLVLTSNRGGNYDIYIMDADGQNVRRITSSPHPDLGPAWSPDGNRILFESYRTGDDDLYLIDADGSNLMRLTDDPGKDAHADWSPDGQKVCYRHQVALGESYLRVINADGSGKRTLIGYPHYHVGCTAWIVRRSRRIFIGHRDEDAGYDPPLGNRLQAAILMHDERSVRSAVGVRTGGGDAVEVLRPATATSALLRLRSATRLRVVESLWMGQPVTCHLGYGARAKRCRIAFDPVSGRVSKVVPM
jgi:Tol biopolymer transport system component